jgi:hypothetical protein
MKDIESKVAELMAALKKFAAASTDGNIEAYVESEAVLNRIVRTALEFASRLPDGWVAVPVEPTQEMREAAASFGGRGGYSAQHGDEAVQTYRDMVSARPEVPHDHCG